MATPASFPRYKYLISRTIDPVFALFIGFTAAAVRIQREQHEAGHDARFLSVASRGWDMVQRRWRGELANGSKENGGGGGGIGLLGR